MIERTLRILLLEDLATDQELIKRQVLKIAPNSIFTTASKKEEFLDKINWVKYDAIISDYNIPGYNGLEAMLKARELMPHVPFIFVTGTLNNEEKAAEVILKGASGYILKENIKDLPSRFEEIWEGTLSKYTEEEARRQQQRQQQILLQKLDSKLDLLPMSEEIDEIKSIVTDLLQTVHVKKE